MPSVSVFVFESIMIFAPALIAAAGGYVAYRFHKSKVASLVLVLASAATLLGLGLAFRRSGLHWFVWGTPTFLGSVILLHLSTTSSWIVVPARRLAMAVRALASSSRLSLLLLASSPLFLICGLWQIEVMAAPELMNVEGLHDFQPVELVELTSISAYTDHGQRIPLFKAASDSAESISGDQGLPTTDTPLPFRAIRLSDADMISNCTGWVFTGAQAWIQCRNVQSILDDNGYQPVKSVRAGDLIIYRDANNEITHAGLVITMMDDGRPLIQSKWGHQGVFAHLPEGTPYGDSWTFYHSSRPNHLLLSWPSGESSGRLATEAAP